MYLVLSVDVSEPYLEILGLLSQYFVQFPSAFLIVKRSPARYSGIREL